jgi:DNA-binding transcriptional ArsR family regulator
MRFREPLNDLFRTKYRVQILRLLSQHAELPFTGREIARNLGLAHNTVRLALAGCEKMGFVRTVAKGRSILYQLNPQHILCQEFLCEFFRKEPQILALVLQRLPVNWEKHVRSVIVFGSVASGEEAMTSDVDLCFLARSPSDRDRLEVALEAMQSEFCLRTGNRFSPFVLTATSFAERYRRSDPLVRRIASEGKVLQGESVAELLA